MRFHKLALGSLFAIAATVGTQSIALSQGIKTPTHLRLSEVGSAQTMRVNQSSQSQFKNPTQPRLSELGTTQTVQSNQVSQGQFKNPTHPRLSEIGGSERMQSPMLPSQMPSQMMSQPQLSSSQLSNGQTFFSHPPRLVRLNASEKLSYAPSTYEFTLTVPSDAGQPLKAVTIVQEPNLETVKFDMGRSRAFAGQRFASGAEIPLASVGGEAKPGEAMIVFDQPVQPGSTVTIALQTPANPGLGGVYEFGVTAFPVGEKGLGQFLGIGRLNLYGTSH